MAGGTTREDDVLGSLGDLQVHGHGPSDQRGHQRSPYLCPPPLSIGILVTSCHRDRVTSQEAIRQTWGCGYDVRFFIGLPRMAPDPDEVMVPVSDSYQCVPAKTHAQCLHAMDRLLDYAFICDTDTYVDVEELLKSDFYNHDYVGHRCDEGHAAGGHGYWLSDKAFTIMAQETPPLGFADLWVGLTLQKHGIHIHHDPRYGDGTITKHLGAGGTGSYRPRMMYAEYQERLDRCKR